MKISVRILNNRTVVGYTLDNVHAPWSRHHGYSWDHISLECCVLSQWIFERHLTPEHETVVWPFWKPDVSRSREATFVS